MEDPNAFSPGEQTHSSETTSLAKAVSTEQLVYASVTNLKPQTNPQERLYVFFIWFLL